MDHAATYNAAFQFGQTIGRIIAITIFASFAIFFIVSLVKAITTRRTAWIVAASIAALPVALLIVLFVTGSVIGSFKGLKRAHEISEAKKGNTSALLTAEMTPFTGSLIPYEISLPAESAWTKNQDRRPYDYVFNDGDGYFGTIVEGVGLNTPQRAFDMVRKNLTKKTTELSMSNPTTVRIDSHDWLTFDVTAAVNNIHFKYRYYIYADSDMTVQLISWSGPTLFDHYTPVFDRIAKSFKFPAGADKGTVGGKT
jgi:hypothetical protein